MMMKTTKGHSQQDHAPHAESGHRAEGDVSAPEAGIPIDRRHFPDEAFRNYVADHFDKDGDGALSEQEVAGATTIRADGYRMRNLAGLKYLRNLECLDLTGDFFLESLDTSHNPKLSKLIVESDSLLSLDVTNNPALTELYVHGDWIRTLDVTKNLELRKLDVRSPDLPYLDLSHNTKLTSVFTDSRTRCMR